MGECKRIGPDTLLVSRRYRAPVDLISQAWTDPLRLKRWFGTPGFDLQEVDIDLRVGGEYRKLFHTPEGDHVTVRGEYREVIKPENPMVPRENWATADTSPSNW